ncbi:hypothetical protein KFE25_011320 [Diacronema lutheri]|uniref:Uncharacterized protein n=1 Tax=Diacronema lutheri TaxID=2081491 RepID=A0A8J5XAI5_DIALT|nr:hypothetical protein KFE25_011320 [Diacronema lutheri]
MPARADAPFAPNGGDARRRVVRLQLRALAPASLAVHLAPASAADGGVVVTSSRPAARPAARPSARPAARPAAGPAAGPAAAAAAAAAVAPSGAAAAAAVAAFVSDTDNGPIATAVDAGASLRRARDDATDSPAREHDAPSAAIARGHGRVRPAAQPARAPRGGFGARAAEATAAHSADASGEDEPTPRERVLMRDVRRLQLALSETAAVTRVTERNGHWLALLPAVSATVTAVAAAVTEGHVAALPRVGTTTFLLAQQALQTGPLRFSKAASFRRLARAGATRADAPVAAAEALLCALSASNGGGGGVESGDPGCALYAAAALVASADGGGRAAGGRGRVGSVRAQPAQLNQLPACRRVRAEPLAARKRGRELVVRGQLRGDARKHVGGEVVKAERPGRRALHTIRHTSVAFVGARHGVRGANPGRARARALHPRDALLEAAQLRADGLAHRCQLGAHLDQQAEQLPCRRRRARGGVAAGARALA